MDIPYCGTAAPRLLKVQDPFGKLIARSKGSVAIGYVGIARLAHAD